MTLKAQLINAGLPLNTTDRDFNRRILSSCREMGWARLRPLQPVVKRYVRLGDEVSALLGTGALTINDVNGFQDDFEKGRVTEGIVDSELSGDVYGYSNTPPITPSTPNHPRIPSRPPVTGPRPPSYNPDQAAADCADWSERLKRPCRIERGRIVNQLFIADPHGLDICHCPSGTFQSQSDHSE